MPTAKQQADHRRWLVELTGIPTAAGREDRVIDWVTDWVQRRRNVRMRRDATGNLVITRTGKPPVHPVFITAHIDHPAFVVRKVIDDRSLELEFRGGVFDPYFESAAIEVFDADGNAHRAVITKLDTKAKALKRVIARLSRAAPVAAGDIARWAFKGRGRKPTIHQGRLYAPACDDLAGVAAALSAFDVLRNRRDGASFGVLLTRAEEIGFIGAIAACKNHTITKRARFLCLENSRSFAESPIGDGPILRVGDRLSVFSPQLTNRIC
ncbi:MAG: M20/M25/M40 family metallo-hydrolase, partial [Planctomycetota bacterium]